MKVLLVEYDASWPAKYEKEKQLILDACGSKIYKIEHIGSTSVSGLAAKPIIDILLGVKVLSDADDIIPAMQQFGYEYRNDFEHTMPYRRYFNKNREYHVHTVVVGSEFWLRHLAFRDYLRTFDDAKAAYEKVKRELAAKEWDDGNDYAYAKTDFVRGIEKKALEYFGERKD